MKKIFVVLSMIMGLFSAPTFADPGREALRAMACGGDRNCISQVERRDRSKEQSNNTWTQNKEARYQRDRDIIRDEELRQQVRRQQYGR